jgi:hypothetical protein
MSDEKVFVCEKRDDCVDNDRSETMVEEWKFICGHSTTSNPIRIAGKERESVCWKLIARETKEMGHVQGEIMRNSR